MAGDKKISRASDLGIRTVSALVMLAISATALWMGGLAWTIFVLLIGVGVWFEWSALCVLGNPPGRARSIWRYSGAIYCGMACAVLLVLRDMPGGLGWILLILAAVIGTDIGAYAFGRTIGGPKIAPSISPSKTWAGLTGGILGAALSLALVATFLNRVAIGEASGAGSPLNGALAFLLTGAVIAVLAQLGDFFESWMKRKAGVKDSGKILPGHGGLFDRVDGLLLVLVLIGNFILIAQLAGVN